MKISKPASRICALLLAVFMLFGMLPVSAFAAGETVTYTKVTRVNDLTDGTYIIVGGKVDNKTMALDTSALTTYTDNNAHEYTGFVGKAVTISQDGSITLENGDPLTADLMWEVKKDKDSGNYTIKNVSVEGEVCYLHGYYASQNNKQKSQGRLTLNAEAYKWKLTDKSGGMTIGFPDSSRYISNTDDKTPVRNELKHFTLRGSSAATACTFYRVEVVENNDPVDPSYTAPTAATLTYNGEAQVLVTGGTVTEGQGTMLYKVGNGQFSETVPSATNAGTYTVSWMVDGAEGYNDVVAEQPITVTIAAKTVTPAVTVDPASVAYDGTAKQPTTVTVKDGETVIPASEYTVATTNNTNAGTATVTVTDKTGGNYAFTTATGTFTITAKAVTPTVTLSQESYSYDGTEKKPTVTVKVGESLIPETEYEVTYADNINAGTAKVTVTDKAAGNYTFDPVEKPFTISAHSHNWTYTASGATITATCSGAGTCVNAEKTQTITVVAPTDLVYSGTAKVATITGAIDGVTTPAIVYSAAECKNVGEYTASVTLGDKTAEVEFEITAKPVTPTVTVDPTSFTYDGTAKQPTTVTVKDGETVIPASEYTVASTNNINAGTATVTVTDNANGNYAFTTATGSFTITAKTVTPTVTVDPTSFTYDGTAKQPTTITVKDGETVIPASEYTVVSTNNTNAGTATVTVTDKTGGNYAFTTATGSFTITAKTVTPTVTVAPASVAYDGTAKQPTTVTVKDGETTIPASEYTVESTNNTNAGTATVTVTDKTGGNYAFSTPATGSFTITAKSVTPTVTLSQNSYVYDGTAKQPTVTVKDGETVIPAAEYTVTYADNTNAGTAKVTVTDNANGNYSFTAVTKNFTITAPAATTKTYTKVDAEDVVANDKIVIVGNTTSKTVALDKNGQEVNVTVSGNTVTVPDSAAVVWTVGNSTGNQPNGQTKSFTFNIDGSYLARKSGSGYANDFEIKTSDLNNKYVGHYEEDGTFGNDSGSVEPPFYGLAYTSNGFKYVNSNDNTYETVVGYVSYYKEVAVADDDDDTVAVTGVTLSPKTLALTVGGTGTLTATVAPAGATNKAVTWTSSNTSVATVNNGVVTAVASGNATITVTTADGSFTDTCAVTVSAANVAVTGVTLTPETLALTVGGTGTLTATVAPAGATNKAVTWTSSNTSVATVNNGVVTAVASGNATITVTTADGSFTDTCAVTVTAAQPPVDEDDEPTYTKINASDIKVGDKIVIVANNNVALANDSDRKATVSVSGNTVTVAAADLANVIWTVEAGESAGTKGSSDNNTYSSQVFEFINGQAHLYRESGTNIATAKTGTISGDDVRRVGHVAGRNTIGNFNNESYFYGLNYGSNSDNSNATEFFYKRDLSASSANVSFYRVTNVDIGGGNEGGNVAVTGVTLTPETLALTVGGTGTLTATVAPAGATNKAVTWTSSNTSVATVNNGVVTAVASGNATITVTTADGSFTDTCAVTVTAAQTPDEDDEPTYTKINASDIKVGDKIVIVANNNVALANDSDRKATVSVSGNTVTVAAADLANVIWTVEAGESAGTKGSSDNNTYSSQVFEFINGQAHLYRESGTNIATAKTGTISGDDVRRVGHVAGRNTIGNFNNESYFYGLNYGSNSDNSNATEFFYKRDLSASSANVSFYRVTNVDIGGGNEGGGNEGGSATNPTGTTFLAFSSDAHTKTKNVNEGSPARLNNWLNNVSSKISGTFDIMALCGDFTYDGGSGITGTDYWDHAAAVMSVVENSAKVDGHVYINGNHEWQHGTYDSYKSSHDAAKKITGIGQKITGDDYIIYTFGAASSNQSYNTSDITALGNWLKTAPTNKPIFIISHYPIHSISGRSTTNADTLLTTLNEYADDHDIYFVWGHNHTKADSGENHYDKIYTGTLDNQTIKFTYMAAGCMSDSENNTGSAAVKGKGLVAKIVDGKVETLTYYAENGNVVGTPYEVPDDSADPDQPGTEDPEDPIVPDEPGKVTTLEDGYYIIVSNNNTKALTNVVNSGYTNTNSYTYSGFNGADVTIANDKITAGATEVMVFEIKAVSGGYTIRNVEKDQYLTATYTQNTSGSGYTGKLFLSDTAETWELDSNFRLKSTNASATGRDGLGLYLTFDDKTDSISSGAANFFGIRSEGDNHDFANVDKIDFYKVEVEDEPEPDQPEQPDHEHAWGDVTYTFAANGASCTATRACTGCETTETATATITSAVKTAATCETMGTTTYTATFTEEWAETQTKDVQDIPMADHAFEDGECTNCGAEDPAEADLFELYGANMALGNNLSMNFYIETADLEFGEDYYAVITKDYADDREDYVLEIQDEDWQEYSSSLYRITMDKIAAKEMADKITVVIYNDEDEQVSKTWVDSVRAYTMRGIEGQMDAETPSEKLMAVYVEMLNYGAAAQEYFDYNVDDLANNELTDEHLAYGIGKVQVNDFRVSDGAFFGSSLTLESNILMNFYFKLDPADYEDLEAVATYTDHYGKEHEVLFDEDDFSKYNSTTWGLTLDTLVVADCREFVTVEVYDADGQKLASVTDSIESYAARMGDDAISVAIMTFAVAAYNNFH